VDDFEEVQELAVEPLVGDDPQRPGGGIHQLGVAHIRAAYPDCFGYRRLADGNRSGTGNEYPCTGVRHVGAEQRQGTCHLERPGDGPVRMMHGQIHPCLAGLPAGRQQELDPGSVAVGDPAQVKDDPPGTRLNLREGAAGCLHRAEVDLAGQPDRGAGDAVTDDIDSENRVLGPGHRDPPGLTCRSHVRRMLAKDLQDTWTSVPYDGHRYVVQPTTVFEGIVTE
jgi:hypothetical protein